MQLLGMIGNTIAAGIIVKIAYELFKPDVVIILVMYMVSWIALTFLVDYLRQQASSL